MGLKEMGIDVGKMARLTKLAEELGIEPEEGQDVHTVAEAMLVQIDSKDDNEWEAMSADLKEWSNTINSAKKLALEKKPAKAAAKSKAKPTEEHAAAEKAVAAATKKPAKAAAKKAAPAAKAKKPAAPAAKVEKAAPTKNGKKDLAVLKAQAKAKADAAPKKNKQPADPNGLWRVGTTAWHAIQVLKDAGKDGITLEEAVKEFDKRVKKYKLVTSNPASRINIVFRVALNERGLATKEGKIFRATDRLMKTE